MQFYTSAGGGSDGPPAGFRTPPGPWSLPVPSFPRRRDVFVGVALWGAVLGIKRAPAQPSSRTRVCPRGAEAAVRAARLRDWAARGPGRFPAGHGRVASRLRVFVPSLDLYPPPGNVAARGRLWGRICCFRCAVRCKAAASWRGAEMAQSWQPTRGPSFHRLVCSPAQLRAAASRWALRAGRGQREAGDQSRCSHTAARTASGRVLGAEATEAARSLGAWVGGQCVGDGRRPGEGCWGAAGSRNRSPGPGWEERGMQSPERPGGEVRRGARQPGRAGREESLLV